MPGLVRAFTSDANIYGRENLGKALRAAPQTAVWPHLAELILFESKHSATYFGPMARERCGRSSNKPGRPSRLACRRWPTPTPPPSRPPGCADVHYLTEGLPRLVGLALDEAGSAAGRQALEILNALGANACPAVAALMHALGAADPGVRDDAAGLLEELGRLAAGLMPRVLTSLRDGREETRSAAAAVLQWVGPVAAAAGTFSTGEVK